MRCVLDAEQREAAAVYVISRRTVSSLLAPLYHPPATGGTSGGS